MTPLGVTTFLYRLAAVFLESRNLMHTRTTVLKVLQFCRSIPCIQALSFHVRSNLSDEIGNVHWHFFDICVVELLDIFKRTFVFVGNEVYCHAFAAEASTATDPRENIE